MRNQFPSSSTFFGFETDLIVRNIRIRIHSSLKLQCDRDLKQLTRLCMPFIMIKTVTIWHFHSRDGIKDFKLKCCFSIFEVLTVQSTNKKLHIFKQFILSWMRALGRIQSLVLHRYSYALLCALRYSVAPQLLMLIKQPRNTL